MRLSKFEDLIISCTIIIFFSSCSNDKNPVAEKQAKQILYVLRYWYEPEEKEGLPYFKDGVLECVCHKGTMVHVLFQVRNQNGYGMDGVNISANFEPTEPGYFVYSTGHTKADGVYEETVRVDVLGTYILKVYIYDNSEQSVKVRIHNIELTKSLNNPMIIGQFGSMWYNGPNNYHAYYSDGTNVLHATSSDGERWAIDKAKNPVLRVTAGQWDATAIELVNVWKEGITWYVLYRARNTAISNERHIGLATSINGINWTKNASNPVLSVSPNTWEVSGGKGIDPWGIMKIGSTYYLWYNTVDPPASQTRATGLATSTDLVNWTKNPSNPIFQNGRYCVQPFQYGSYYYMLVPYWDHRIELYLDSNPTFYPNERKLIGTVVKSGVNGEWDHFYLDTPSILTNNIYRNSFSDDYIWIYYTGLGDGLIWEEGLTKYPLAGLQGHGLSPPMLHRLSLPM